MRCQSSCLLLLSAFSHRALIPSTAYLSSLFHSYPHTYSRISYEVIIIEDNSPDGTLEVAQQLQVRQELTKKLVERRAYLLLI